MKYRRMHPLARLKKMLAGVQQLRRDLEWWNNNRTDCEPFDIGPDILWERAIQRCIDSWGTPEFNDAHTALNLQAIEYARSNEDSPCLN